MSLQPSEILHYASAIGLFCFLVFYSLVVFPRVVDKIHHVAGKLTPAKSRRNRLYYLSSTVIVLSMIAIASQKAWGSFWNEHNLTFWFESIALMAFGLAWMIKGRFMGKQLKLND